ncbi:MAG: AMP-binding protein [Oscillospiraceae bacterium]|nr:AMP-binding protein [Oscillospiraceae bacterium]
MSVYKNFCHEITDEKGDLKKITLDYPDNFNFGYDVVDKIADETPQKRAMVWCNVEGEEHIFTFGDIKKYSNKMANVFTKAGIGRGDRVMLVLKRHYEYWFAAVALHKIGAVMIPATHMLTVHDFVYRIKASNVRAIVCTAQDEVPEKILKALKETETKALLWSVQAETEGFDNLTAAMEKESGEFERVSTKASDPMMLYFTSGTTGQPKGVIHDYAYPLAHIVTAKYWQRAEDNGLHFTVAETGWAKASWGKIYGQWLVGSAVMVYDFDNFEPKQLTYVINRYGVTSFCAPPTVYRYLVRKGIPDMPTLKHASTAGEMLAPEVFRKFTERTGLQLREGYGQTETTLLMANFGESAVEGSMGTPSPFYNIRLQGRDGREAGVGEIGEVVIIPEKECRQVGVFTAYLDNEEQYAYVWRGGVYHTGDAAYMDENGRYWFHGRFDDIIKTGGFRVGPYEVENVLMEHPAVVECSVIGVPDALRGQAIKAVVVLGQGFAPTKELELEIKEFCNKKLAEYKWIRIIEFADAMPKTISGKIQKNVQRKAAAEAV